jgi:hypothetical protein
MSRDWPDLGARTSAHVAQHTTLTIATPQPPAAAMASHDVYCANSPQKTPRAFTVEGVQRPSAS